MDVAIAGGHGKVALRLARLLSSGGHRVRAVIRNPDHAVDVEAAGAEPVVLDLEALAGVADLAVRHTFEVIAGDTPTAEALAALG